MCQTRANAYFTGTNPARVIKYLQLQKTFDASKMQAELASLGTGWREHYNKAHYEGEWSVLPLRSINGNAENPVSVHAAAGLRSW